MDTKIAELVKNLYESNSYTNQNTQQSDLIDENIYFEDPFSYTKGKQVFYKNFSLLKYFGNEITYQLVDLYKKCDSDPQNQEYLLHGKTKYKNKYLSFETDQYNNIKLILFSIHLNKFFCFSSMK